MSVILATWEAEMGRIDTGTTVLPLKFFCKYKTVPILK
jgi:hypothetical protein